MARSTLDGFTQRLGPGLITGAADDDPSGIATYSQAGSQFRFGLVWTLLLTTPLMIGIQMLSARIGWVTGRGLASNIGQLCPRWLTVLLVGLLVVANTINIAADIGAMGEAVRLLAGVPQAACVLAFGALCLLAQVVFSYERTVRILKWLTLALFSYVAVILSVQVPWRQVAHEPLHPWAGGGGARRPPRPPPHRGGGGGGGGPGPWWRCWAPPSAPTSSSGRPRRRWRTTAAAPTPRG